jgi:hypothetical protein
MITVALHHLRQAQVKFHDKQPNGTGPWVTVHLEDTGGNQVRLVLFHQDQAAALVACGSRAGSLLAEAAEAVTP